MYTRGVAGLPRRLVDLNRGSFNVLEAAFYEAISGPAVRAIVSPVLAETLREAPPGPILDVGCGSGSITDDLQSATYQAIGADPSLPQLRRLHRRHGPPCVAAPADALPFADGAFTAVVSSCSVKHWPVLSEGLSECVRVLSPGGSLTVVEIDGGDDADDLLRFAARSRVPWGLRRAYRAMARRSFVPLTPDPGDLVAWLTRAGLLQVRAWRVERLPFFAVTARRPEDPTARKPSGEG